MSLPASSAQPDTPEARRYNQIRRRLSVADVTLGFAFLAVLLAAGWTGNLRDIAWNAAREHYALALFFYVGMLLLLSKLLSFGLDFYSFRLEHRFQLSNQKLGGWIGDQLKEFLLSLVLGVIALEVLYWIVRSSPEWWWVIAWAVFIGFSVLLAQIAPVLLFPIFYKFIPLENEDLKSRLIRLSERAGTRVRGVYEWKLSEKSKKANAALTGLGNTRRIILADTLLENYSPEEIEAVLAHELGHHVHKHIFKSILVQVIVSLFGFWAVNQVLRYAIEQQHMFEQMSDFANLPLLILVSSALSLLLVPALNAYSRYNERQADEYSWKSIPSTAPFVTAMNKLCAQNLGEREPSRIVEILFHSHPPIAKRIAAAEQFSQRTPQPS